MLRERHRSFWVWDILFSDEKEEKTIKPILTFLKKHSILDHEFNETANERWEFLSFDTVDWFFYKEVVSEDEAIAELSYKHSPYAPYVLGQKEGGYFEINLFPLIRIDCNDPNNADKLWSRIKIFFENSLNFYEDILRSPVKGQIFLYPIIALNRNSLSILKRLNNFLFDRGFKDPQSLCRAILPRIFLFSNITTGGIALNEDEINSLITNLLQIIIVDSVKNGKDTSPLMREIHSTEGIEWKSAEEISAYSTVVSGNIYFPYSSVVSWATKYTLREAIELMEKIEGHGIGFNFQQDYNVGTIKRPELSLKPEKLDFTQGIREIKERWSHDVENIIEEVHDNLYNFVKSEAKKIVEYLDKEKNTLNKSLRDAFNLVKNKKESLNNLLIALDNETVKLQNKLENMPFSSPIPPINLSDLKEKLQKQINRLDRLIEKDKRYPKTAGKVLLGIILWNINLLLFMRKLGQAQILLVLATLLTPLVFGYFNYFYPTLKHYKKLRKTAESNIRREVSSFIESFRTFWEYRYRLRMLKVKLKLIETKRDKLNNIVNKEFLKLIVGTINVDVYSFPFHTPILQLGDFKNFIEWIEFNLEEFATENAYSELVNRVEKNLLENQKWNWDEIVDGLSKSIRLKLGDSYKLLLDALELHRDLVRKKLSRVKQSIEDLIPLKFVGEGQLDGKSFALLPDDKNLIEMVKKEWGITQEEIYKVEKDDLVKITGMQLINLLNNIPFSTMEGR